MRDISKDLNTIMQSNQCSPVYALLLLYSESMKEGDPNRVHKFQSESKKKTGRRLRN